MCVGSEVVDPGRIVTIDVPGTGNTETATCAEWFGVGCEFVEPDLCADYQEALVDCCIIAPPAGLEPTTSPAPSSLPVEGGNSVRYPMNSSGTIPIIYFVLIIFVAHTLFPVF